MITVYRIKGVNAVLELTNFVLFTFASVTVFYLLPVQLSSTLNYLLYLLACGFTFTYSVARVIVAHLTKSRFPFWDLTYLPLLLLGVVAIMGRFGMLLSDSHLTVMLILLHAHNMMAYMLFVVGCTRQFCQHLEISWYKVGKQSA